MADTTQIREHMDVVGSDGQHHYIPAGMVSSVEGLVRLSQPASDVMQQWQAA